MMLTLPVTAVIASVLALVLVRLSFAVITLRRRHKVSLGSGGHDALERAIRAHGNFAEYAPIGLVLLACLESNGAPWWLVAVPGAAFVAGRLFHAKGVNQPPPNFGHRILGMQLTLSTLLALAVLNVAWLAVVFLG